MGDVYYKLDKKTRDELISTVKGVAIEILEGPKETWITADEVTKISPFFSKEWMKRYGYLLPRKRIVTINKNGEIKGHWFYSRFLKNCDRNKKERREYERLSNIYVDNEAYHTLNMTLEEAESQLDPQRFMRVNRQFIISAVAVHYKVYHSNFQPLSP